MDVLSLMNYLRVFCGQTAGSFLRELNCATIHFLQSNEIINDHIASFSCFYIFFRSILFSCKSIYRWSFRPHTQKKRKKLLLLLYRLGILIFFFLAIDLIDFPIVITRILVFSLGMGSFDIKDFSSTTQTKTYICI